jgi:hypothetical protein
MLWLGFICLLLVGGVTGCTTQETKPKEADPQQQDPAKPKRSRVPTDKI